MRRWFGPALVLLAFGLIALAQTPAPLPPGPPTLPGSPLPPLATPSHAAGLQHALDQLKTAREALAKERQRYQPGDTPSSTIQVQLQLRIVELMGRLETLRKTPPAPPTPPEPKHTPDPIKPPPTHVEPRPPGLAPSPSEPLLLASYHFRASQIDACLGTIARLDPANLTGGDRIWVSYLKACCLRRQGKLQEAIALYREVAESRIDPFLTESAIWHLGSLRWRQEMQAAIAKSPAEK